QTKLGAKSLVDSGVAEVPSIFFQRPEDRPGLSCKDGELLAPVIDLCGMDGPRRSEIVNEIKNACEKWAIFQIVNHGVPTTVMNGLLEASKRFHEQPSDVKLEFQTKDPSAQFTGSNFRAHSSSGRDTINYEAEETDKHLEAIPLVCREAFAEYLSCVKKLTGSLRELFSEALGLPTDYLGSLGCMEVRRLTCHYYTSCPQPELIFGTRAHTDPYFLTILLQDNIGGLQALLGNRWVNVPPVDGALVINLGDFMQLVTNDKFKAVDHRVLAQKVGPRLSAAVFLSPSAENDGTAYGPIKQLLRDNEKPLYREATFPEYFKDYTSSMPSGIKSLPHFQ
ncbi:Deacetoxyvindoline 4-hydroxylase, partial [Bertholletia excelsa]